MKISTATSVFVNHTLEDTIRYAAEAGYDGIDIWGGRPHIYRRDFSPEELRRLRDRLSEAGLAVPSLMPAFYRYPHSLVSPCEAVRQDSLHYMYECIDNAVALGAGLVLIVPTRSLFGQSHEDAWKRLVDSVFAIGDYASQYDIRLAVEPANREVTDLVNTAADALRVIEAVGIDGLGVALDTGHIHLSDETPQEAVEKAGKRLLQVHVNDNDGKRQQNLILGEGTFDFPGFLSALRASGYDGFLTAELGWTYTLDPFPAVREMAWIMRTALQG